MNSSLQYALMVIDVAKSVKLSLSAVLDELVCFEIVLFVFLYLLESGARDES